MTYAFGTLVVVAILILAFLVIANRHANEVIRKRDFERVAHGTKPHLAIVPIDKNTAAENSGSTNAANWRGHTAQAASLRTSGRVQ